MFGRSVSEAHICLRCRLARSRRPLSAKPPAIPAAISQRSVRRQHNATISESAEAEEPQSKSKLKYVGLSDGPLPAYVSYLKSRPDSWRSKYKVVEKIEPLNVDSLGKPAEIVVMRHSFIRPALKKPPIVDELELPEQVDILDEIEKESLGTPITWKEVEQNIHDLRPRSSTGSISWEEFRELEGVLEKGFTGSQLGRYIKLNTATKSEDVKGSSEAETTSDVILYQSPWFPDKSEFGDAFDISPVRGYVSPAHTPKQLLALRLIRQCWQIHVDELVHQVGELELELDPLALEILLKGQDSALKKISARFLTDDEERIEVFRSRNAVRVTATKKKAETLAGEIRKLGSKIQSLDVDLEPLVSLLPSSKRSRKAVGYSLDPSLLSEVATITNTEITGEEDKKITVSYLETTQDGPVLSTRGETARRLLLTSHDFGGRSHEEYAIAVEKTTGPFAEMNFKDQQPETLSWRDRTRNLARLTTATRKEPNVKPEFPASEEPSATESVEMPKSRAEDFDEQVSQKVGQSLKELRSGGSEDIARDKKKSSFWDSRYFTESTVLVGHLLHEMPKGEYVVKTTPKDTLETNRFRLFKPASIQLTRFLQYHKVSEVSDHGTKLKLRFLPSPWTRYGPQALKAFPELEMQFSIDPETGDLMQNGIVAIAEQHANSIMLPDRPLDLRFQQRITSRMRWARYTDLPQLAEFLENSNLSTMSKMPLGTPPTLTLPIAQHLCDTNVSLGGDGRFDLESNEMDVEYIFVGLSYQDTIAMNFYGWKLFYTTIEAGKAGGRRHELKLKPTPYHDGGIEESQARRKRLGDQEEKYGFIDAAYLLAEGLRRPDSAMVRRTASSRRPQYKLYEGKQLKYWNWNIDLKKEADQ